MATEKGRIIYEKGVKLAAAIGPQLAESDRADVESFMNANEGALGLDLILFLIERRGLHLPDEIRKSVYLFAKEIDADMDAIRRGWPKN
jgi:hypothetical protein